MGGEENNGLLSISVSCSFRSHSRFFLEDSFRVLCGVIEFWFLQACPAYCSLLFLIASMMFGFRYSDSNSLFFLILQSLVPLSFTYLNIFLSKTRSLFLSVFRIAHISNPYVTIGLIKVLYNCVCKSLFSSKYTHLYLNSL